jgi:hypothetical protein
MEHSPLAATLGIVAESAERESGGNRLVGGGGNG